MAIKIQKPIKSTVNLTLQAGGTLLPNTTYYLTMYTQYSGIREGMPISPMSDVKSIATDTANLSINMEHYWEGEIAGFSDGGGGYVNVNIPNHGFNITGSGAFTISDTVNYNQLISCAVVDKDTIRFVGTYVADETGHWKHENDSSLTVYFRFSAFLSTINPYDAATDTWITGEIGKSLWTNRDHTYQNQTTNFLIAAPLNQTAGFSSYGHPGNLNARGFVSAKMSSRNIGMAHIIIDAEHTIGDLVEALTEHGAEDYFDYYQTQSGDWNQNTRYLHFYLRLISYINWGVSGQLTAAQCRIVHTGANEGNVNGQGWNLTACEFTIIGCRRPFTYGSFTDCMIFQMLGDSPYWDRSVFDNCTIVAAPQFLQYGNTGVDLANVSINFNSTSYYVWWVYPRLDTTASNIKINKGYFYLYGPTSDRTTYLIEDLTFTGAGRADYEMYYHHSGTPLNQTWKFLNIVNQNTNAPSALMRLRRAGATSTGKFEFYYRIRGVIKDSNGDLVDNASVIIIDKDGTQYSTSTDEFGVYTVDVLGYEDIDGADQYWGDVTEYGPFTMTASKDGYETITWPILPIAVQVYDLTLTEIPEDPDADGLTKAYESESMRHLFLNEAIPKIGDAGGLLPALTAGFFYVAVFTQDPGEPGSIANEATFGGYARVAVPRGPTGWSEYLGKVRNINQVNFPDCTGGAEIITHYALMKEPTGSEMVARGELNDPVTVIPQYQLQFSPTQMEFNID